jgi:glutathione S-transferase
MNRLITIPFSHYCEKARWALDLARIPYSEDGHLPLLHRRATKPYASKTVPILVTDKGALTDSTDILVYVDTVHSIYPAHSPARADALALEDLLDKRLGPHSRRVVYFHLLDTRPALDAVLRSAPVPAWQHTMMKLLRPAAIAVMKKGLGIHAAGAARSEARVHEVFAELGARLERSPYLSGDTFGATDLTFASLASPLLLPPEHPLPWPARALLPAAFVALSDALRETKAGAHALRCYRDHRRARPQGS